MPRAPPIAAPCPPPHQLGMLVVLQVCPGVTVSLWRFEGGSLKLIKGVGSNKVGKCGCGCGRVWKECV